MEDNPRFFDLVGNVRSMRRLKPDPIPESLLMKVLNAGVQAPSGMNSQPWAFLVLRRSEDKHWFADRYRDASESRFGNRDSLTEGNSPMARQFRVLQYQMNHMHEFPVLVMVCGLRDWAFKAPESERVGLAPPNYGAVYPCVQSILMACRGVGLGAALTTMHQVFENELMERFRIRWNTVS
ncbi:nitroreductase family protein [Myxococcota bacterium]|nr:nitroreductase family protein [Myxococcota bacterium]